MTGALPIPMILYCPNCGSQHVDKDEAPYDMAGISDDAAREWTNPPHRSHLCANCGCIWRPADVATTGVAAIKTAGKADTWVPAGNNWPAIKAVIERVNKILDNKEGTKPGASNSSG